MRKLFKERKLFKGGNYMRKYGTYKNKPPMKRSKTDDKKQDNNLQCTLEEGLMKVFFILTSRRFSHV